MNELATLLEKRLPDGPRKAFCELVLSTEPYCVVQNYCLCTVGKEPLALLYRIEVKILPTFTSYAVHP